VSTTGLRGYPELASGQVRQGQGNGETGWHNRIHGARPMMEGETTQGKKSWLAAGN
jgi:hypothetical protein